jgi:hypothetical protein
VLIGIIYWFAIDTLHQQLSAAVDGEIAALVEANHTGGASRVADGLRLQHEQFDGVRLWRSRAALRRKVASRSPPLQ